MAKPEVSTPGVPQTPSALPTPAKPEKETPSSAAPVMSAAESAKGHLEALKKVMGGHLPEEIESQLKVAIDKTTSTNAITHGHLHRVSNAQKSLEKSKQAVRDLDAQWKAFTATFQERWAKESQAYIAKRETAMEIVAKARIRLQEAEDALQKAATTSVPPPRKEEELMDDETLQKILEPSFRMELDQDIQTISDAEDQNGMKNQEQMIPNAMRPFAPGSTSPKRRALADTLDKK